MITSVKSLWKMNAKTISKRCPDSANGKPCSVIWTITASTLFSSEDTYPSHFHTFEMDGFTVRIENSLLAEALENLDGKKRDVILRYYFLGFDDTEISKILEVNRSTIQRRRHAGLEFIKKFMEEEA